MPVRLLASQVTRIRMLGDGSKNVFSGTYGHSIRAICWILLIFTAVCFGSCASFERSEIEFKKLPMTYIKGTESIYCQLLSELRSSDGLLLVEEETALKLPKDWDIDKSLDLVRIEMAGEQLDSIFSDFKRRSIAPNRLDGELRCNLNTEMVESKEVARFFTGINGWMEIHNEFPILRYLISFSSIGYNEERTQALILMQHNSGEKSGSGDFYLLIKAGSGWRVKHRINFWVS